MGDLHDQVHLPHQRARGHVRRAALEEGVRAVRRPLQLRVHEVHGGLGFAAVGVENGNDLVNLRAGHGAHEHGVAIVDGPDHGEVLGVGLGLEDLVHVEEACLPHQAVLEHIDFLHDAEGRGLRMVCEGQCRDAAEATARQVLVEEGQLDLVRHEDGGERGAAQRQHGAGQRQDLEDGDGHRECAADCGTERGRTDDGEACHEGAVLCLVSRLASGIGEENILDRIRDEKPVCAADQCPNDHRRSHHSGGHGQGEGHDSHEPLHGEARHQGADDSELRKHPRIRLHHQVLVEEV
mmetsp:Transcript_23608/g.60026  ORF Transcript_23608/g.60026 Transcript_23608/m.60026 type:complete len:294 (+) Transcript_23608:201-1082(+)